MHISSEKLLQMKQFNGKSSTFTIKLHRLHEQIVWVPCDPRDDQVDPNWSFVRVMKSSTSGLGLSLLVASRHDCLNSWLIPKSNRIDYKIIVLLIYLKAVFITSGKNYFPLNLKRKCNYFWQLITATQFACQICQLWLRSFLPVSCILIIFVLFQTFRIISVVLFSFSLC